MALPLNLAFAQINPLVGDIAGNSVLIRQSYEEAIAQGADLLICPECCLIGYPAEDMILIPAFRQEAMEGLTELAQITQGKQAGLIVGSLWCEEEMTYNVAVLLSDGKIHSVIKKHSLPNEGVFDEKRVFHTAAMPEITIWKQHRLGIIVCKDMWEPAVIDHLAGGNAEIIISINASPFEHEKDTLRKSKAAYAARTYHIPVAYVNQCGGQDELVFDGGSFLMNQEGTVIYQAPFFASVVTVPQIGNPLPPTDTLALMYQAIMTGLKDYIRKNGFKDVLIGLSGGIDSALTALVAVDALGAENVQCVMLPSPFTSAISLEDAEILASLLGVRYSVLPISEGMYSIDKMLCPLQSDVPDSLAKENIQSRLRGLLLMAISNSTGRLLITTGNKSEMATGYATLYGDMCGAYSVLKDVYKTEVFALSRWRNTHKPQGSLAPETASIPERIIIRPPSAELRENQKDEDSLPPYDVLDAILRRMIEERQSVEEIAHAGYDAETVRKVHQLLKRAEYKRRQAPPGVKLTPVSFGRDWRMPLTRA